MQGWIKLHRQFTEWEWYRKGDVARLFIHLLLTANHEDKKWQGITVRRGQIVVGRKELALETGLTEQTIRTCILKLKSTNEITTKSTNKYTIVTIVKYEQYQHDERKSTSKTTSESTNEQPTTNQQLTTNNNGNNVNNIFTVPEGTITIALGSGKKLEKNLVMSNYESFNDGEVTYEQDPDTAPRRPKQKSKYGRRVMSVLVRCFLKAARIDTKCATCNGSGQVTGEVGTTRRCFQCMGSGEYINASRFLKPLSQLLDHCGGDADKVMALIEKSAAYFDEKKLSWNLDTVNRDHDLIDKWRQNDRERAQREPQKRGLDISERRII